MEKRTCAECGESLTGRSDKKFCGDGCRNAHHNRVTGEEHNGMRRIILALKRNRRILERFFVSEQREVNKTDLLEKGYDYRWVTHICLDGQNREYRFCFDYGFVECEDGRLCLVTDRPNAETNRTIIASDAGARR